MFHPCVLAENIRKYRIKKKMSQRELARVIHISPQSVSKWERGSTLPDTEKLFLLARALETSIDVLLGLTPNKKVIIGVDGGGTKTELVCFDEDGKILDIRRAGPCNPNSIGLSNCIDLLSAEIGAVAATVGGINAVHIGSAGFLLGGNGDAVRAALRQRFSSIEIRCATDMLNVIASATNAESCIAVICGTGSSVLVKRGNDMIRLGGYGYLLSSGGSGYDIGRDAARAVAMDLDGLGAHTTLTKLLQTSLGTSVSSIIDVVYKSDSTFLASLARLVVQACEGGDTVARSILEKNAQSLASIINHAATNITDTDTVVISGGLVQSDTIYYEMITSQLLPRLNAVAPHRPQIIGACRLGAELAGIYDPRMIDELEHNYNNANR